MRKVLGDGSKQRERERQTERDDTNDECRGRPTHRAKVFGNERGRDPPQLPLETPGTSKRRNQRDEKGTIESKADVIPLFPCTLTRRDPKTTPRLACTGNGYQLLRLAMAQAIGCYLLCPSCSLCCRFCMRRFSVSAEGMSTVPSMAALSGSRIL